MKLTFSQVGANPPSVRQIRDNYNAILRFADDEAALKSARSTQKTESVKTFEDDDNEDKKSIVTPTPKSNATIATPISVSSRKRSDYTTSTKAKKSRKRKRGNDSESESEDLAMSTENDEDTLATPTPTPSKRILPRRNVRNSVRARYANGVSDEEGADDAAKDFGGVGSDAEYEDVAE